MIALSRNKCIIICIPHSGADSRGMNRACLLMNENNCLSRIKCLIVEDNYFAADIMAIFFKNNKIECEIAENGEIGLQIYTRNPEKYDVIFCDLQMPVMDGNEMTKLIRRSKLPTAVTVPIVAMSGTVTGDIVSKIGFSYFLKKPFELHSLLSVINRVLDKNNR